MIDQTAIKGEAALLKRDQLSVLLYALLEFVTICAPASYVLREPVIMNEEEEEPRKEKQAQLSMTSKAEMSFWSFPLMPTLCSLEVQSTPTASSTHAFTA